MNDEKFDEIMKNWVAHETESAPQLCPKKEMYQMVKAKKQKVFFPVFARWATIGAAAVFIIGLAILHPNFFRSAIQSSRQQEFSETLEREEDAKKDISAPSNGIGYFAGFEGEEGAKEDISVSGRKRTDAPATVKPTTFEKPVIQPDAEPETRSIADEMMESRAGEQPLAPPEDAADSAVGQSIQPAPVVPLEETVDSIQPAPITAKTKESDIGRRVQPPPGPQIETSRPTSEAQRLKGVQSLAVATPDAEGELDSDRSFYRDQRTFSEVLAPGKDREEKKPVGPKTFREENGVWIDTEHSPDVQLFKIKRNSQAYNDLIVAIPELKSYVEIGQFVIINLGEYSLEIADDGKTTLTDDELKQFVQE